MNKIIRAVVPGMGKSKETESSFYSVAKSLYELRTMERAIAETLCFPLST